MGEMICPGSQSSNMESTLILSLENYFFFFKLLASHLENRSDNTGSYVLGLSSHPAPLYMYYTIH